jgi:DNA helicase-2/ATP-dependent DNA helicase PcrA
VRQVQPTQYSHYQQAIFKAVVHGSDNLLVNAYAGSGKSTTLRRCVELLPKAQTKIYAAFNRAIVEDMLKAYKAQRINPKSRYNLRVSTLNSYGASELIAWRQAVAQRMPTVDANKTYEICQQTLPPKYRFGYLKEIAELVRLGKTYGIAPKTREHELTGGVRKDRLKTWARIIGHHGLEFDKPALQSACIALAREVLEVSVGVVDVVDFDDQLYLPLIYNLPLKNRYDVVLVDESQDLSAVQRRLIRRMMKDAGRVVFVGDRRQAIYGFRGADAKSIERIQKEFGCVELPLSITYRCPTRVVRLAQKLVPGIEAAPNAPAGVVDRHGGLYNEHTYTPGDLVLCRNNAPLVTVFSWLKENSVPCRLLESQNTADTLTAKLQSFKTDDVNQALQAFASWKGAEVVKLLREGKNNKASFIEDMYDMAVRFAKKSKAKSVRQLSVYISWVMSSKAEEDAKRPAVILSTVHRCKGMEANNVFLLDPDLIPSKYAQRGWEKEQERNIAYVAVTRAKQKLVFIQSTRERLAAWEARMAAGGRWPARVSPMADDTEGDENADS